MRKWMTCSLLVFAAVSCKFSPETLAKDYCQCRQDVENGKKKADDCKEMAESHFLRIQDDDAALKEYTERTLDCITTSKIKTE